MDRNAELAEETIVVGAGSSSGAGGLGPGIWVTGPGVDRGACVKSLPELIRPVGRPKGGIQH